MDNLLLLSMREVDCQKIKIKIHNNNNNEIIHMINNKQFYYQITSIIDIFRGNDI